MPLFCRLNSKKNVFERCVRKEFDKIGSDPSSGAF